MLGGIKASERARKARERAQRYRDARKNDPEHKAKVKFENQYRYQFNKSVGSVKHISLLDTEAQNKLREKWRSQKSQQRQKKRVSEL